MRKAVCLAALLCAGCVSTETVTFLPKTGQQALVRDGQPAIVSRKPQSIVLLSPASRQLQAGGRPVFVVGINNLGRQPLDFRVSETAVAQIVNNEAVALKVISYEQLVTEERNRQVFAAVVTGLAAGANSVAAAQAGHYNANTTIYTPRGVYTAHTTGYNPAAAAIAQSNANLQNEAMISATIERGQRNMAMLERGVIKDNTLLPGEWYGGQLHIQPLVEGPDQKSYSITVKVGSDLHHFDVVQGPSPSS